jgi:hypothetical protein
MVRERYLYGASSDRLCAHRPAVRADYGERAAELFSAIEDSKLRMYTSVRGCTAVLTTVVSVRRTRRTPARYLRRWRRRGSGCAFARYVAGAPLVRRVDVGVKETDGERLDAPTYQSRYCLVHLVLV